MSSYKSRKAQPKQRLISSFFFPLATPAPLAGAAPAAAEKTMAPKKITQTPEKNGRAFRTLSNLVQRTQSRSSFEEPASSDTSFASPDIDNFRNPLLKTLSGVAAGLPKKSHPITKGNGLFVDVDEEYEKENTNPQSLDLSLDSKPNLKRAATSNLLDFLNEKPKKPRKKPINAASSAPPSLGKRRLTLSDAQIEVIDAVVNRGENVFFTGSAGTGKSVVLRSLVEDLYRKHGKNYVGVTASTGLAACNINGQTIHKFLSIGLGKGSPIDLVNRIKKNPLSKKRWTSLRVLLIDEILMIDGRLFTKLDEIAKVIRNNPAPFGGIQIVCSGDFYQLPPVDKEGQAQYCFNSPSWKKAMKHTMVLRKVFRQEGDNELIDMLNALREGSFTQELLRMFHLLKRRVDYTDGIEPTELFPTRDEVKRANESRLLKLASDSFTFKAIDNDDSPQLKRLYENLMCEEKLTLKVGAQVMYLKNHPDNTVVNGSIGRVIAFLPEGVFGAFFASFSPDDFIDPTSEFILMIEILYNAIGASTLTPEYRSIFESLPEKWRIKIAPLIKELFVVSKGLGLLPVVLFTTNNDSTLLLVRREEFTADSGRAAFSNSSTPQALVREQLPLVLAWAMSIHKSQGQSIDRLRVDLRRTFEKGQIYVALSRATNKEHLEVYNFDHRRISVSKEVQEFYKSLKVAGEQGDTLNRREMEFKD